LDFEVAGSWLEPEDEPQPASKPRLAIMATAQPARDIRVDVIMTSVRRPSDALIIARQYRVQAAIRTSYVCIS
jgi:hypothetical protein